MRLILHIGVWKTGSSAIQSFLNLNRAALRGQGILSPSFTTAPNGRAALLRAALAKDTTTLNRLVHELWQEADAANAHTLILSCEHYWPSSREVLDMIASALKPRCSSVEVVAYLRPQDELWGAILAQQAKSLRVKPGRPLWGDNHFVGWGIARRGMFFARCLRRFERVFDAKIAARHYNRSTFPDRDVVRSFLELTGVPEDGLELSSGDANLSLGWKGLAFSMSLAADRDQSSKWRRSMLKRRLAATVRKMARRHDDPDWMGRAPVIFDGDERARIRAVYAEDEKRLADRFFDGVSPFPPPSDPVTSPFGPNTLDPAEMREAERIFRSSLGIRKS